MKNLSSFGNVFKWFFCLREPTRLPYRSFLQKLGKTKETKETKIWILGLLTFFLYMFSQQSIRAIINYLVNNTREQILTSNSGCKVICAQTSSVSCSAYKKIDKRISNKKKVLEKDLQKQKKRTLQVSNFTINLLSLQYF